MTKFAAVTKERHAGKSWAKFESYRFAAGDNLAPLVGAEVAGAALTMPMAFIKERDHFRLVGLLSLTPGQNMFVSPDGRWIGAYVPSGFRGYPFRLAKTGGSDDLILCVDEDSGLVRDDESAEPFFDGSGEIAGEIREIMDFLGHIEKNRTVTDLAVSAIAEAGLITEWGLTVRDRDREKPVAGLYIIDEAKLNSLDDGAFLELRKSQALPIAYAQLLSMGNIRLFEKLSKFHEHMSYEQREPKISVGDDDLITFG